MSDADIQQVRALNPGITKACLQTLRWGGIRAMPQRVEQCYEMEAPRRWRGLWSQGFETSRFCPTPAQNCTEGDPREQIWLTGSTSVHLPQYEGQASAPLYEVEFIGRKTAYPGQYDGLSQQEIIVDRMISMKQVPRVVPDK